MNPLDLLREGGSLGILAFVVVWLTRRLNGKLDRLADAVEASEASQKEVARATRSLARKLDREYARR